MAWRDRLRRAAVPPDPIEAAMPDFRRGDHPTALTLWEPLARAALTAAQQAEAESRTRAPLP